MTRRSTRKKIRLSSRACLPQEIRRSTPSSWAALPKEVRRIILDLVSCQKGWGSATVVCKEWQSFIAAKNLRRLELDQNNVHGLAIIIEQRHLVREIFLNIELPRITCYTRVRAIPTRVTMSKILKSALRGLFWVLATWDPTNRLTFELNAYSPTDSRHWFKNHLFGFDHEDDENFIEWHADISDHGWLNGKQVVASPTYALRQLFNHFSPDSMIKKMKPVPIIKALVIRRQMRRQIHPELLSEIVRPLTQLESIAYEPWRILNQETQEIEDRGNVQLHNLPTGPLMLTFTMKKCV
ncbi:hypothetical protein ACHAPU_010953 [Fusarium lateritium]